MDTALIITVGEGVSLSDVSQSFGTVHVVDTLVKVVRACIKFVLRIHFDAAQSVNDILKTGKVDPEVVVDIDIIELGQGVPADINAVNTCMGEFVGEIALIGNGQRYIVVTRSGKLRESLPLM